MRTPPLIRFIPVLLIFISANALISCSGGSGGSGGGSDGSGTTNTVNTCNDCDGVVYVRYPADDNPFSIFVSIPQGEKPYDIAPGADLMYLKEDGTEITLVDCETCSVMDPFISYDGSTVYYSYVENATDDFPASWIYKINLAQTPFKPVRLTYDNGFDSKLYAGNTNNDQDLGFYTNIRDMSPVPLSDGRLMFTSNRNALIPFHPGTNAIKKPMQQIFIIDDHDGTAITPALANMTVLETGSLHMVQHPVQLKDGRILFSSWHDVGTKFTYAMTNLMTVHPDGSNLQQFTEPHDHRKNVEHFVSQLSDGQIVSGSYYPSFDYGYGLIKRYPLNPDGPDFIRDSVDQRFTYGSKFIISQREFDRKGTTAITPHTVSADIPAPDYSGKYSMPSATKNNDLLVAYSTGTVNHFNSACNPKVNDGVDLCEALKSGIYMIKAANSATLVTNPDQLVKIKDDPLYNEIWPRAVLSYREIYGVDKPAILSSLANTAPVDNRLETGEAAALYGTSSMYNRELLNETGTKKDAFQSLASREGHDGNWTIQGADAGVFSNSDIYGVRIIATPPIPFTKPLLNKNHSNAAIDRHLHESRLIQVPSRFGSYHGERWEILGEFPLAHKGKTDAQGNPDSSWLAKIPADTPTFVQTIDNKGMTLTSELTWRGLKSGEMRADCGGCHAHSVEPLAFETTESGKPTPAPITSIPGVIDSDPHIQQGMWDLTRGDVPLITASGVVFDSSQGASYGVEFYRDVKPILDANCKSCHSASGGTTSKMPLDGTSPTNDAWAVISKSTNPATGKDWVTPQRSRYIRIPQARQSLLVWVAWGQRLDGRTNGDRTDDIDYTVAMVNAHTTLALTDKEKRTIARWVDLGGPINFPTTDGFGYTDDYQLPVINIHSPFAGTTNTSATKLVVGFADAKSGIDWPTLKVNYYPVDKSLATNLLLSDPTLANDPARLLTEVQALIDSVTQPVSFNINTAKSAKNVLTVNLPPGLAAGTDYVIEVTVKDKTGNMGRASRKFSIN
ncbi:MAG TPA: hypothetical protein ENJ08_19855 [Gammaproteobacteria bacterium]|nr:hypothetical protein [Gammaproteobacteria bacterium]